MIDAQRVARAEPGEVLLGAPVPLGGEAQRLAVGLEIEQQRLVLGQRDAQPPGASGVEAHDQLDAVRQRLDDARRHDALGRIELLARDHALGELDELVGDRALRDPDAEPVDQLAVAALHVHGERAAGDVHAQGAAGEYEHAGDRVGFDRHRRGASRSPG